MRKIKDFNDERIVTIISEFEEELDKELKQYQHLDNGHTIVLLNFFKRRGYVFKESELYTDLQRAEYYFIGEGKKLMDKFEDENPDIFI